VAGSVEVLYPTAVSQTIGRVSAVGIAMPANGVKSDGTPQEK
jgi:hypothetical protein